ISFDRRSAVVEERAWQRGVLRAVGVRTSAVWRSLIGESLLVGAAGVALGIPLGIGLGRLLVPVIATASAVADKLIAPPAALAAEPGPLLLAGALGLVTAVLAAALPAWRAARVAAAETMRSRGHEAPGASARAVWVLRGVAPAAAGGRLADLVVTSVHVTNGYVEAPVSEELAHRLAAVPGVAVAIASRVIDWPHGGRRVALEALDARYFTDASFGRWPLARQQISEVWERV